MLLCILLPQTAFARGQGDKGFIDFINDDENGSWFDQAIELQDKCDFSKCGTDDCATRVFNATIFEQECAYVSGKYGVRARDWQISGESAVDVNKFGNSRYYDDLEIEVFAESKKQVLHFEVTSSVHALREFEFENHQTVRDNPSGGAE